MEDSGEGHSEDRALPEVHSEEKALPDTNKKRRFKTPSQVQALEDFYNEQKYPTDLMKAELAEKLGLTEKQISGWFCHRRLKDRRLLTEETQANGRQDLSGGVAQDRGSGLRQDSCGSTKRGDYKPADLREVESRRLYDDDLPPTQIHHGQRGDYGESEEDDDDTSSESDSDLQDGFHPRGKDIADVDTLQYGMPNGLIPQSRGRVGPSGYLKIKGQVENVAITAVKRQLGRHYREDGPPLGVDFDPLPPDAFESQIRSGVHERSVPIPLDVRGARWPPTLKNDLYVGAAKPKLSHGSDEDILPYQRPLKKKSNGSNAGFSRKPSFSTDEHSGGETSVYDGIMNSSVKSKHAAAQGMKSDPFSYPQHPSTGKITVEQTEPWLHNYDASNPKASRKRAGLESKFSSLKHNYKDSLVEEELVLPSRIREPDEVSGDRRAMRELQDPVRSRHLANEMKATKRARGFPRPDFAAGLASHELPQLTKQIRGSAVEMPSSFSEDETAETSSSVD